MLPGSWAWARWAASLPAVDNLHKHFNSLSSNYPRVLNLHHDEPDDCYKEARAAALTLLT